MNNRGQALMRARAGKALLAALLTAVLVGAAACAPITRPPGEPINRPLLAGDFFHTADGQVLPVKSWRLEKDPPRAVLIALHGFNDYSNFFAEPGAFLATRGIASYAYDQRGFGNAPGHGLWPGIDALVADLKTFAGLVRDRNPGTPLYLLGESMGGAVIMVAIADADAPEADGVILAAPAVWGRVTMPWYQRLALWIGVRLMPGAEVTGRGLKITPSDNIEMLKALGRDPLVIKATRIDAIYGLTNLMDGCYLLCEAPQRPSNAGLFHLAWESRKLTDFNSNRQPSNMAVSPIPATIPYHSPSGPKWEPRNQAIGKPINQ